MPLIVLSPDGRTVALHTPNTTYAIRLEPALPLHWGDRLPIAGAVAIPAWQSPYEDTFEGPRDGAEEFPAEGGRSFGPAALSVRHPDRTGGLDLALAGVEATRDELTVRLADRGGPIEVDLHYRVFADTDVIERWSVVRHTGTEGWVDLPDHAAAVWCLPVRGDYRLSHVAGGWMREGGLHRTPVPVAETTLTSRRGVTSHAANPWVMLDDGTATEETGEVWSAALAFSGSWRITVSRTAAGRCAVHGYAGHDRAVTRLRAGEQVTSPVFAAVRTTGGFGGASRAWHAYQRKHVLPHPGESRPVLYNSWEATTFDVTEQGQRALAERAAKLGAELFVVDDGWFGARTSDRAGLGDWKPDPGRFPYGLGPLADHIRDLGMDFGIWVEPEMVSPDSDLYRAHPDWVLHVPRLRPTELRHQLVLDFTRADVRDWAFAWIDELVRSAGLAFLKWDFNRPFTQASPDSWTGHTRGVYDVLDRLREAHPGLRIEACAGGGGRADLGILARTDQVWTSDNTDAVDRVAIQNGYTQVYAPGTMVAWVTDSPNALTGRRVPLSFRFHVAMAGVLGIGGDLTRWTGAELEEAAALVALYRLIRPVVQQGTLYRLNPPAALLTASQYLLGDQTVVFVWQTARPEQPPADVRGQAAAAPDVPAIITRTFRLHGLISGQNYRDDGGRVFTGEELMTAGLPVELAEEGLASALIRLVRFR